MFTIDKSHNAFLFLKLKILTSYFKLKQDIRKIDKYLFDMFYNEEIDKEKTITFIKQSKNFIKEDENYFYIKNNFESLSYNIENIEKFIKKFKTNFPNYKLIDYSGLPDTDYEFVLFDKDFEIIFPEFVVYIKD